jgi:DNA-binding transcriptional LysR family regulator
VARLERELDTVLFRRTTRSLAATDAGQRYYEHAAQALSLLRAVADSMRDERESPSGLVKISVPTTYGLHRLMPRLPEFARQNPRVELEVQVSNRNIDFVRDGFDLAIRLGVIADQALVARRLGTFALGVFASPAYLARRGRPQSPDDLAVHDCITFVMPRTGRAMAWEFSSPALKLQPLARYRGAEDVLGLVAMGRAGLGLVQTYDFMVQELLQRGELIEVLPEYRGSGRPFSLVYPRTAHRSRALRAFVEFVLAEK